MTKKNGEPCVRCNTSSWYKNGSCITCSKRNGKINREKRKQKRLDDANGRSIISSGQICSVCGDTAIYTISRNCVTCAKNKNKERILKLKDEARETGLDYVKRETCHTCGDTRRYASSGECITCQNIRNINRAAKRRQEEHICTTCHSALAAYGGYVCKTCSREYSKKVLKREDRVCPMCKMKFCKIGYKYCRECHNKHTKIYDHNRHNRIKEAGGTFTTVQWTRLFDFFQHKCLHPSCLHGGLIYDITNKENTSRENTIHIDHVISVSNNGTNDISNLQPLCQHHNLSKHTDSIDYRPYAMAYLDLKMTDLEKIIQS